MLLALAQWLAQDVRTFNVLNYITLRAVLAANCSVISVTQRRESLEDLFVREAGAQKGTS